MLDLWSEAAQVVSQITPHRQLSFATYQHGHARTLAISPLAGVGDAMSPQLGLGTTLAVQDALELAAAVATLGAVAGPLEFSKRRLRTVHAYQMLSRVLTPCFQSESSGWWRDVLFAAGWRFRVFSIRCTDASRSRKGIEIAADWSGTVCYSRTEILGQFSKDPSSVDPPSSKPAKLFFFFT